MKTRVNNKGQILIPADLRRKYGIVGGTAIVFLDNGNSIVLKPITDEYLRNLQGSLKGSGSLNKLLQERRSNQ